MDRFGATLDAQLSDLQQKRENPGAALREKYDGPLEWRDDVLPGGYYSKDAARHVDVWVWAWHLENGVRPRPRIEVWPRGGGKCVRGSALVTTANGEQKAMRDVAVGDSVMGWNETTGRVESGAVQRRWQSGEKQLLKLCTRTGRELEVTPEHRVCTFDGWKKAGDLSVGDRIPSPRRLCPPEADEPRSEAELRLLAYMLAEGSTSAHGKHGRKFSTVFTNGTDSVREDFRRCATEMGFPTRQRDAISLRLNGKGREWVREQGMAGCTALTKRVPRWVFRQPEETLRHFFAAFMDTDGWFTQRSAGIDLANEKLIGDLRSLALRLGLYGRIYKRENDHAGSWSLTFDPGSHRQLLRLPMVAKQGQCKKLNRKFRCGQVDTYPNAVTKNLPYGVNRQLRAQGVRLGTPGAVTRGKIQRAIQHRRIEKWLWLEQADVMWDEVCSVEPSGREQTFDIQVEGLANFFAGGLLVHNSTTIEGIACLVGAAGTRDYVLYVSGTQDQADDHVGTVRTKLEGVANRDPDAVWARRLEGRYGQSQGWKRDRLRTATGFTVDALGMDSAARGAKLDDVRPDLIIIDDIDGEHDSRYITEKKIATLTRKILGTRSKNLAVLGVQNLIKKNGIFGRLSGACDDGLEADFLQDRIVTGPIPAVEGLETERTWSDELDRHIDKITAGVPTWPGGYDLDDAQAAINDIGLTAFEKEAQHDVDEQGGGIYENIDFVRVGLLDTPDFVRVVVWMDPAVTNHDGSDAYAIQVDALGTDGKIYRLYSWEGVPRQAGTAGLPGASSDAPTGPEMAVKRGLVKAVEWGADGLGIETDQGGDTWKSVVKEAWRELVADRDFPEIDGDTKRPKLYSAKVARLKKGHTGKSGKSKAGRSQKMLRAYERDKIRHVRGTHKVLERALNRAFVTEPFDLADASFWGWFDLDNPPAKAEVIFG